MSLLIHGCQPCRTGLQNTTRIDLIKYIINKSDNIAVYSQIFQKQADSLNQSNYSVSHTNTVTGVNAVTHKGTDRHL